MPPNSGYIQEGVGWVANITTNFTAVDQPVADPVTYYAVFEAALLGVHTPYPRVFKRFTYTPDEAGGAAAEISTVPVYTMIISLAEGVVTEIGWDDGCFFCAENGADCIDTAFNLTDMSLIPNTPLRGCRSEQATCYPTDRPLANVTTDGNSTGNTSLSISECDFKLFVTWTGTDRNKQYMRSAGQRFSRYRQFGVATMYQSALNLADEGLNIANTAINRVESIPGQIIPANTGVGDGRRMLHPQSRGAGEAETLGAVGTAPGWWKGRA
jgi:hypothetical protein